MSDVDDLVTFLRARLDEDEAVARAALIGAQTSQWRTGALETVEEDHWDHDFVATTRMSDNEDGAPEIAEHIARHDPASVLLDVEAKRRIVERYQDQHWHAPAIPGAVDPESRQELTSACRTCVTLQFLALPYSDHEDYRPEYAPE